MSVASEFLSDNAAQIKIVVIEDQDGAWNIDIRIEVFRAIDPGRVLDRVRLVVGDTDENPGVCRRPEGGRVADLHAVRLDAGTGPDRHRQSVVEKTHGAAGSRGRRDESEDSGGNT